MRYLLEVRTRSPLVIAARPTTVGLPIESRSYIPGTSIRGAIAGKLLRKGEDPGSIRFHKLFLEDKVRYGNLYPVSRGPELEQAMDWSIPLPATAVSCKWQPGFALTDVVPDEGHGVFDTLIAHLAMDDLGVPKQCNHAGCGADLEPFSGFYETDGHSLFREVSPGRRLISRTAMDSVLGAAKGGALYTLQAVNEREIFSGFIEVDPSLENDLTRTLQSARLRTGSDRTRGLGDVEVSTFVPIMDQHFGFEEDLAGRLALFEDALQSRGGLGDGLREAVELGEDSWTVFPLTLYSDAIVIDEYMRYQTSINVGMLRMYGRCWPDDTTSWPDRTRLIRAFASTSIVAGWNSAHQLPKPRELVIDRGSVFVFAAPRQDRDTLISCLQHLEKEGIGERRDEGFGQVIVGHPFHLRGEPT